MSENQLEKSQSCVASHRPLRWGMRRYTFAITESDNIDSWGCFLACIKNKVTQRTRICVISDRHPSIMTLMSNPHLGWAVSFAYHRICMRHLASNFMTHFKDKFFKNWYAEHL